MLLLCPIINTLVPIIMLGKFSSLKYTKLFLNFLTVCYSNLDYRLRYFDLNLKQHISRNLKLQSNTVITITVITNSRL